VIVSFNWWCLYENIEEAFWRFVDLTWKDSPNVAAAEPAYMDYNPEGRSRECEEGWAGEAQKTSGN
jgi:hypothetical protein